MFDDDDDDEELLETGFPMIVSIWREGFTVDKMDLPGEKETDEWLYEIKCDCHGHVFLVGTREECDAWLNPLNQTPAMLN